MSQEMSVSAPNQILKAPTGIQGLDEITRGGLPHGRPTLVCGPAGCGKTLLAMEFIIKGITECNEHGVFITFDEYTRELGQNVASLGFDLDALILNNSLMVKEIDLEEQGTIEVGEFDLEGLFAQIGLSIDRVEAKRVAIDGIETLFSYFTRESTIRRELMRLFRWLKQKEVTVVITGEGSSNTRGATRHGIEEYISDCVIYLDQRIQDQIATRRLHIQKYRGSVHDTNEFPFLITGQGISVLPVTSLTLDHQASRERVSTGIQELDEMLGGQGYYRGSSILVSGTAGTGKSCLAAHFARSLAVSGKRCLYFAFEESAGQIIRNMDSMGLDLEPFMDQGLLHFHAMRPTQFGLEMHLLTMTRCIKDLQPAAVIFDPISNLTAIGEEIAIKTMFMQILDHLKQEQITALCTDLTPGGSYPESTEVGISSITDTWILLRQIQKRKTFQRSLYILKSRGMNHSGKLHPFELSSSGICIHNAHE